MFQYSNQSYVILPYYTHMIINSKLTKLTFEKMFDLLNS